MAITALVKNSRNRFIFFYSKHFFSAYELLMCLVRAYFFTDAKDRFLTNLRYGEGCAYSGERSYSVENLKNKK